ncbi:hypothetical protein V3C99_012490 [Haemonchus contortus]
MPEEGFYLKESRFMANFWQNAVPPDLKTEISLTWQELKEQVEQVEELDTSWTSHCINSTCSDCHPEKLILIASRFLRMANSTKDNLSRLKQHLLLLDSWHSILEKEKEDKERMEKDIDKDKITLTADGYIQKVDRIASEIDYELCQLLKNIPDQNNNVPHGKNAMEVQAKESAEMTTDNLSKGRKVEKTTDDEYLLRLISETTETADDVEKEEHPQSAPQESSDRPNLGQKSPARRSSRYTDYNEDGSRHQGVNCSRKRPHNEIERELEELERGLRLLPTRKIAYRPQQVKFSVTCAFCEIKGAHFSDSCPEVREGHQRRRIIRFSKKCFYCLGWCKDQKNCEEKEKECWYCSIVRDTALDFLIPDDDGHHRALCAVPNSKDRVRDVIQNVRQALSNVS